VACKVVVIGYGNPGRGDDEAGPLLADKVEEWGLPGVTVVSDYQLNIEHAADLAESDLAIFIDASVDCPEPWELRKLAPENRNDFTTHAMLPETVLETCVQVYGKQTPSYVLAVRGDNFDLGAPQSAEFSRRIKSAADLLSEILRSDDAAAACEKRAGS
jgi:hydrogenase maturation protease